MDELLQNVTNYPDYARDSDLDLIKQDFNYWVLFNPATTGFQEWYDYLKVMDGFLESRFNKFTMSPFHFIPKDREAIKQNSRTTPALLGDGSCISNLLDEAKEIYKSEGEHKRFSLMRLGTYLHTFADTYSHQLFTGNLSSQNIVSLEYVYDNIKQEDVTTQYKKWLAGWFDWFRNGFGKPVWEFLLANGWSIGHLLIYTIPDLSHLKFSMSYTDGHNPLLHSRSNTDEFLVASEQIFNLFRQCIPHKKERMEWCKLSEKLRKGFLIDLTDITGESKLVEMLTDHWNQYFQDVDNGILYHYDSEAIKKSFEINKAVPTELPGFEIPNVTEQTESLFTWNASDDFYNYNIIADKLLIALYGKHPRYYFGDSNDGNIGGQK